MISMFVQSFATSFNSTFKTLMISHMINQYLNVFLMFHLYSNYIPVQNFIIELVFFLFCMLNVAGSEPRYDPFVKC